MRFRHVAAASAAVASLVAVSAAQAETVETVATGLDNPRSVSVGPDGAVYVANSGRGGSKCEGEGEEQTCFGSTGRIVKVENGTVTTVSRGFASFAGADGTFAGGVHGVSVDPAGNVFALTGSGTPTDVAGFPKSARRQVGRLFDADALKPKAIVRVDQLEWKNNFDGVKGDLNSNPYAVLALEDRQIVVDAGANALYQVRKGKAKLLAVIPKNGKSQAVPSSITLGPDGAYYVGELAEGAGPGKARVFRVPAKGGKPKVYAKGFTTITGVAFGPDGSLYVTELGLTNNLQGDVIRVTPSGQRTTLGAGQLIAPQGAAFDKSGALYVSTGSTFPATTPAEGPFMGAGGALTKITP